MRILVVDDEPMVQRAISRILPKIVEGCAVFVAGDGVAALELLERELIDVVLTDSSMPRMHGLELIGRIAERWPQIPTILMTALPDEVEDAHRRGQHALSKPLAMATLTKLLNGLRD